MHKQSSIQLIRNATLVLNYSGKKFLIDPMLAEKEAYPGLPGTANAHLRNPLTGLPVAAASLLDADAIILTHLHPDHWDQTAQEMVPKDIPIYVQNDADAAQIRSAGFTDCRVYEQEGHFEDISFQRTDCQHGPDEAYAIPQLAQRLGKVSGLLFSHGSEKSVYIVGDSIWIPAIQQILTTYKPEIVVVNAGTAMLEGFGNIIMGKEDIARIHALLPQSTIIAVHMEAINHCILTRKELAEFVHRQGIASNIIIPQDGQIIQW